MCGTVFTEHEARLKLVDPEKDEVLCPTCDPARIAPYALKPSTPTAY